MAANITGSFALAGQARYFPNTPGIGLQASLSLGRNDFSNDSIKLAYGTGSTLSNGALQVNDWYQAQHTIAATTTLSIDLSGNASYTNPFGTTLAFTAVKLVILSLDTPDGAAKVYVGPQNVSNAAQLWFGGVGAQAYDTVFWHGVWAGPLAGWSITAGTGDLLPIYNPGASSVTVNVYVAGVK